MKGRPHIIDSEEELINVFINRYYEELSKNPSVRHEEGEHIELIESVNKDYLQALRRNNKFDYTYYEDKFIECIDFLTKAITKKKEGEERSRQRNQFMSLLKR